MNSHFEIAFIESGKPHLYQAWDRYVSAANNGTFFHLTGWTNVIKKTFGHQPHFLYAHNKGTFCGILPLILVETRLFGKMLVSNAFAAYGGAVADSGEIKSALIQEAIELGKHLNVDYVEFRLIENGHIMAGVQQSDLYVTFRQELFDTPDENFSTMPREARRLVRRAKESGLWAEFGGRNRLDEFYRVYANNMHDLGTPVFPRKLFENFLQEFPENTDILCVWLGHEVVAAVLSFYHRDTVMPYYGGSMSQYNNNRVAPNHFLYWSLMEESIKRGYKWLDFGRSKVNTGSYHFKRHFGIQPQPLHYQYALLNIRELPNLNPLNPRYQKMIKLWKQLPFSITKLVGPAIVKNIP